MLVRVRLLYTVLGLLAVDSLYVSIIVCCLCIHDIIVIIIMFITLSLMREHYTLLFIRLML